MQKKHFVKFSFVLLLVLKVKFFNIGEQIHLLFGKPYSWIGNQFPMLFLACKELHRFKARY